MERWQQFASGYKNIEIGLGPFAWCWRALWSVAGMLLGVGVFGLAPGSLILGILLLTLLVLRCLNCADVELQLREPPQGEGSHAREPYEPPSRVLGPHHDGVDL